MLWHAALPLPCFVCLRLICAAYFVAFGVTISELGGLLLCMSKLMIKYTVWYRAKPAGNLCERAALVGDQMVMRSPGLTEAWRPAGGGWALLGVCTSCIGGLEWGQGWCYGW